MVTTTSTSSRLSSRGCFPGGKYFKLLVINMMIFIAGSLFVEHRSLNNLPAKHKAIKNRSVNNLPANNAIQNRSLDNLPENNAMQNRLLDNLPANNAIMNRSKSTKNHTSNLSSTDEGGADSESELKIDSLTKSRDSHNSHIAILPLLLWENETISNHLIQKSSAPRHIPEYCALGSISAGGNTFPSPVCEGRRST
jgi:hypothetical protein